MCKYTCSRVILTSFPSFNILGGLQQGSNAHISPVWRNSGGFGSLPLSLQFPAHTPMITAARGDTQRDKRSKRTPRAAALYTPQRSVLLLLLMLLMLAGTGVAASRTFLSARLFNRLSFSAPSSTTATSSSFSRPSARLAGCVRLGARNTHARARLARFQTRTRFTDGKSMARPFQPRYASRTVFFFFYQIYPVNCFVVLIFFRSRVSPIFNLPRSRLSLSYSKFHLPFYSHASLLFPPFLYVCFSRSILFHFIPVTLLSLSFLSLSIFVGSLLSSPSFHNIHYDHTKSREIKKKSTTDKIYARQENTTHRCSTLPYTESRASEPKAYFTNTYTTKTENSARKRASKRERYNWKEHYSTVTRRVERVEITRVAGNLSQTRATEQANERINECKRT